MTTLKMQKTFQIMSKLGYDYVSPVVTTKKGNTFGDVTHHTFEKSGEQITLDAEYGIYQISTLSDEILMEISDFICYLYNCIVAKQYETAKDVFDAFDLFSELK